VAQTNTAVVGRTSSRGIAWYQLEAQLGSSKLPARSSPSSIDQSVEVLINTALNHDTKELHWVDSSLATQLFARTLDSYNDQWTIRPESSHIETTAVLCNIDTTTKSTYPDGYSNEEKAIHETKYSFSPSRRGRHDKYHAKCTGRSKHPVIHNVYVH